MAAIFNFKWSALWGLPMLLLTGDLGYRDAENGKVKILVPTDFVHQTKQNYVPKKKGEEAPDDYFFNKDTTEELVFLTFPMHTPDLNTLRPIMGGTMKSGPDKVYFNDTTTVNGIKMYITEYDIMEGAKMKHVKAFIFNVGNDTFEGGLTCNADQKSQWQPIGEKMLKSLRIKTR